MPVSIYLLACNGNGWTPTEPVKPSRTRQRTDLNRDHESAVWFVVLTRAYFAPGRRRSRTTLRHTPSSAATDVPPDLARRIGEITDAVLEHHIDPPARQQMILGGAEGALSEHRDGRCRRV